MCSERIRLYAPEPITAVGSTGDQSEARDHSAHYYTFQIHLGVLRAFHIRMITFKANAARMRATLVQMSPPGLFGPIDDKGGSRVERKRVSMSAQRILFESN